MPSSKEVALGARRDPRRRAEYLQRERTLPWIVRFDHGSRVKDVEHDSTPRPTVVRNVQALRAVAAILVVLVHASGIEGRYFPDQHPILGPFGILGYTGVDIFFVISGFIMFTTTATKFAKRGASLTFLSRRFIRIYPPYWLVLIPMITIYLFAPERLTQFHPVHDNLLASFLLLPQMTSPLVAVSWTLVFEMYFYIIFSFLLMVRRRYVVPALAIWFCVQLAVFAVFGQSKNVYLAFLGNPISLEFIFGIAVGLLYVNKCFLPPLIAVVVMIAASFALIASTSFLGFIPELERAFVWGIPAMLLVYAAVGLEARKTAIAPTWAVSLGDSSYAMYLWHLLVL